MKSASGIFQNIIEDDIFLGLNRIDRWMGNDTIKKETVGGHSHDVTIIVRTLVEEIFPIRAYKEKLEVTTDATMHDFDEVFSGDITHKVKYNKINGNNIKDAIEIFCDASLREYFGGEEKSARMFLESTTDKNQYSHDLIKVADWLSMAIFSKKEVEMGNKKFKSILGHCIQSLNSACDTSKKSLLCKEFNFVLDLAMLDEIKNLDWYREL